MRFTLWMLAASLLVSMVACSDDGAPECRSGADCASGVCLSNGRCAPLQDDVLQDGDIGPDIDSLGDVVSDVSEVNDFDQAGDVLLEVAPDEQDDLPFDAADSPVVCSPNQDGVILRSEMPIEAGLRAIFRIAAGVTVDTAGESGADDNRVWDLSGDLPGDHSVLVELYDPTGEWFAPTFPDATYFAQMRDDTDLWGVFQATDEALLLLGVVSAEEGFWQTELVYDPPVVVLSFPLHEGDVWSTESTVEGWALGVYSMYSEDYESQVDAHGTLVTPFGSFPVLRVRVEMTRTVGMLVTSLRSFLFVTECFGTIASIHSLEDETEVEFMQASEVRRLAP